MDLDCCDLLKAFLVDERDNDDMSQVANDSSSALWQGSPLLLFIGMWTQDRFYLSVDHPSEIFHACILSKGKLQSSVSQTLCFL